MPSLEFEFEWQAAEGVQGPELASTWASLMVRVNDSILTRVVDHSDSRVRECIHVPLYPIAEWLATNWWCLLHESEDRTGATESCFRERHALGYSREGYRYPDLQVVSFDKTTRLTWKNDRLQWSRLEFLEREGCQWVDKKEFRHSCAKFVDSVVAQLSSSGVTDTLLQEEWGAIQDADEGERRFCQTAAALGWDPYVIDQEVQAGVFRVEEVLGGAVLEEALPILHAEKLEAELATIERVLRVGKAKSIPLERIKSIRDAVIRAVAEEPDDRPWKVGYSLARQVRSRLDLDGTPLPSWRNLGQALGEPCIEEGGVTRSKAFNRADLLEGVVTSDEHGLPGFAIRPGANPSCRFRFCRGLAEMLLSPGADALVTSARSSRQQRGRAFAAEFLAPSSGLEARLPRGILDEDDIGGLASEFGVSPWVIELQVVNHGIANIRGGVRNALSQTLPGEAAALTY